MIHFGRAIFTRTRVLRALLPLFLASTLPACAPAPDGIARLDLASQPQIFSNEDGYYAGITVMVHPNVNLTHKPTALFVPMGLTQELRSAYAVSEGVSRQVWQCMLNEGTFSTLELADMAPPYRADMALPLARQMGAELLIGGYITYYFDGGSTGDSRISLQLEVYDTKTGAMLWSMAHAGMIPYQPPRDFILLEVTQRMPADPMGTLIASVAGDMARLLHMWTDPEECPPPSLGSSSNGESAFGRF